METIAQEQTYMPEFAAQQEAVESDPFTEMMQAEFGREFGPHLGAPALEGTVQFSEEEIDAQVAEFAAEMNRLEATAGREDVELSAIDRAVLGDRISMRAMTEEELAQVQANERRARAAVAAEHDAFAFAQLVQTPGKDDKANN